MAAPSLVLAWALWRFLPEPERGGQSWLELGEEDPKAASDPANRKDPDTGSSGENASGASITQKVREAQSPAAKGQNYS